MLEENDAAGSLRNLVLRGTITQETANYIMKKYGYSYDQIYPISQLKVLGLI